MSTSNDQEYKWTVADVRNLDIRLANLETSIQAGVTDIRELKNEIEKSNHVVVDNTNQPDWKAITILIGSAVAAGLAVWAQIRQ